MLYVIIRSAFANTYNIYLWKTGENYPRSILNKYSSTPVLPCSTNRLSVISVEQRGRVDIFIPADRVQSSTAVIFFFFFQPFRI